MRPLNPDRPSILDIVTCRHPSWPTILKLRHRGFSLQNIADAFNWQGPVAGLNQLCDLFMIDLRDRPGQTSGHPSWSKLRTELVNFSLMDKPLTPADEQLRCALSALLGEYLATVERRQHIADPVPPAVLPALLTGEQLLLNCCLNIESMPDKLPPTEDSHFYTLRAHVRHVCERHLGRLPLPQPERVLELAAGY